jgi:hypothetical protein
MSSPSLTRTVWNTPSGITAWTNSWSAGPKYTDSSRATAGLGPLAETAAGESRHHGVRPVGRSLA